MHSRPLSTFFKFLLQPLRQFAKGQGCSSVVECLPSKHETMDTITCTAQINKTVYQANVPSEIRLHSILSLYVMTVNILHR